MKLRPKKQQVLQLLPRWLVLVRGSSGDQQRYLTFDDGPDPAYTPALLDLLARYRVHATFFLVGEKVERFPELVDRIVADGHTLGNHSYSHWSFAHMTQHKRIVEVERCDRVLSVHDQRSHHLMRPPRGHIAPSLLLWFARRRRQLVHWSYDSMDYQAGDPGRLLDRLRTQPPAPGDIVLMHDDSDLATRVLATVLPEWLAAGHRFAPLPASTR
jgi:peptidoglycan/xylan/chitin deacetylase (PgdA/CDA1 family)